MRTTKIESFTNTWNPVQGCLKGCRYCYAAGTARRFGGHKSLEYYMCQEGETETRELHILDEPMRDAYKGSVEPYPFGFDPTYCRYKLTRPANVRRPCNVFVCSMGDLFGPWFTDEIILEVEQAARAASHHNFCFLTKYPARYNSLPLPAANFWRGATIDTNERMLETLAAKVETLRFLSLEHITVNTSV